MGASHSEHDVVCNSPGFLKNIVFVFKMNFAWCVTPFTRLWKSVRPIPGLGVRWAVFPSKTKQTTMQAWDLISRFPCCLGCPNLYRHLALLKFVAAILDINRTHCSYCLSRLLYFWYWSFQRTTLRWQQNFGCWITLQANRNVSIYALLIKSPSQC